MMRQISPWVVEKNKEEEKEQDEEEEQEEGDWNLEEEDGLQGQD